MVISMKISENIVVKTHAIEHTEKHLTIYYDASREIKSVILYFHGGAMIFGTKNDLPTYHINALCSDQHAIIAFDYPLAPQSNIDEILKDVKKSIEWFLQNCITIFGKTLPYFLWGRSCGGYLCLKALEFDLKIYPIGVISFYGYGLLTDGWCDTKSEHYLKFTKVDDSFIKLEPSTCYNRSLEKGYLCYVGLRQQGKWFNYIKGEKNNLNRKYYSLKQIEILASCKVFLVHSRFDPDVPFAEFTQLLNLFVDAKTCVVSSDMHDFDRDTTTKETALVMTRFLSFLNECL